MGFTSLLSSGARGEGVSVVEGHRTFRSNLRAVERLLSGSAQTEHLDLRFRPGAQAEANAERIGPAMERELARICARLDVKNDRRYRVFLFDDLKHLQTATKSGEFVEGFAAGNSLYAPFTDLQTITHELVHVVARAKIGQAHNPFLSEGLANALLPSSHGVQVHMVAKYYRTQGLLPRLTKLLNPADFKVLLKKQRFNGYDVAGSWMRFLLETYGPEKVKQYYLGRPAVEVFGLETEAVEEAWWTALDGQVLRREVKALLATRAGRNGFGPITKNTGERVALSATLPAAAWDAMFQWKKDGVFLERAVGSTLSLRNLSVKDSGAYEAIAFGDDGEILGAYRFRLLVIPVEVSSQP